MDLPATERTQFCRRRRIPPAEAPLVGAVFQDAWALPVHPSAPLTGARAFSWTR
jgi:hypothetical protein